MSHKKQNYGPALTIKIVSNDPKTVRIRHWYRTGDKKHITKTIYFPYDKLLAWAKGEMKGEFK